jgi:hypothetical protein
MDYSKIEAWIPYKLQSPGEQPLCCWLDTFGKPFIEPFFDETILKCGYANPLRKNFLSTSSLDMMMEWANGIDAVQPDAFIFHISRCGSTLISQLLASSPKNVSLAEVPFFDDILRLPFKHPGFNEAEINSMLKTAVKYYSYKITTGGEGDKKPERLFIKVDSWHIFYYAQLRRLYPGVPFILMYRSPDEVFRSHRKQAGMHAVPGMIEPELFGFEPSVVEQNAEVYLANVLAGYLNKYLEIAGNDTQCMLLNYSEGPMQMIKKIASFANINLNPYELLGMEERSHYHSKKPGERFSEDAVAGFPACLNNAMELYHVLEEKRLAML